MEQSSLTPKKPLNFVIKQQLVQTLRRTDVYVVENNDTKNSLRSISVNNWRNENLIKYDNDEKLGSHTITFMGEVVAQMNVDAETAITKQHKDILAIGKRIERKSANQKKIFVAKKNMTVGENLAYQRALKEFQHARFD